LVSDLQPFNQETPSQRGGVLRFGCAVSKPLRCPWERRKSNTMIASSSATSANFGSSLF
jgi:hypothetical protein